MDQVDGDAIKQAIKAVAHMFPAHQAQLAELVNLPDEQLFAFLKTVCANMPEDTLRQAVVQNIPEGASTEERNQMFASAMQVFASLKS